MAGRKQRISLKSLTEQTRFSTTDNKDKADPKTDKRRKFPKADDIKTVIAAHTILKLPEIYLHEENEANLQRSFARHQTPFDIKSVQSKGLRTDGNGFISLLLESLVRDNKVPNSGFVCDSKLLVGLGEMGNDSEYPRREGIRFAVQKVNQVFYMCELQTEEDKTMEHEKKRLTSYISQGCWESKEQADHNLEFNVVYKTELAQHSLIYKSEIGGCLIDDNNQLVKIIYVHRESHQRNPKLKFEGHLAGTKNIVTIRKKEKGLTPATCNLESIDYFQHPEDHTWEQRALNKIKEVFDFIANFNDDEIKGHCAFLITINHGEKNPSLESKPDCRFLPYWFVQEVTKEPQEDQVGKCGSGKDKEFSDDEKVPVDDPSLGLTLKDVINNLEAETEESKQPKDFEELLQKINDVYRSRPDLKMPLLMVAPEDPYKLLAQGLGISKVRKKLKKLCKAFKFKIVVVEVTKKTCHGMPIYTDFLGLGSWPIYKNPDDLRTPVMATGLFVQDDGGRLFAVTACHGIEEFDADPDDEELRRASATLTNRLGGNLKLYTKTENQHPLTATGDVIVSFNRQAVANQAFMTDIALIELQNGAIDNWLKRSEGTRGCPMELHYVFYPFNDTLSQFTFQEGIIAGILPIDTQSDIDLLAEKGVHIFIRGHGDAHGVVLKRAIIPGDYQLDDDLPIIPGDHNHTMAHSILFKLNSTLMRGTSGSAVMVRNKVKGVFYIIGILHGMLRLRLSMEIYVATSLSASLNRLTEIYQNQNPGFVAPLTPVLSKHAVPQAERVGEHPAPQAERVGYHAALQAEGLGTLIKELSQGHA